MEDAKSSQQRQREAVKDDCEVPILQALRIHREQQSMERQKLAKHRKKCLEKKDKYLGLVIDGMDQKKTMLPHFMRPPKNLKEENFIQLHVVGALVFNGVMSSKIFINFPNTHNDPNLTITIIQNIIEEWQGELPPILYLQLDNTSRENKNQVLLAYLNMLVQKKIFKKVKLAFLLVGHTHDQIDQMFSRFSIKLAKKSAFDLPQICVLLEDAYVPKPSIRIVEETYDFRSFAIGRATSMPSFSHLNDHSFQHQFRIKQVEEHTLMWCKKYSNSEDWLPAEGLKFLLFVPCGEIQRAKYMLLSTTSETQEAERENRLVDPIQCLNEIKETIHAAHVYFPASSLEWWESFFTKQVKLVEELKDDTFQLEHAFVWVHSGACERSDNVVAIGVNNVQISADLLSLVHGETREMYLGPRKSTKRRQHEREMWEGDVNELHEGTMIAVLATNDENDNPFWLAKVTQVYKEQDVLNAVEVHWYRTTGEDPLKGKYAPEMLKPSKKGKKSGSSRRVDTLNLEDVEILVYGFDLKKSGHLRKTTIEILKQKVKDLS